MLNTSDRLWTEGESWEGSCADMSNMQVDAENALSLELIKSVEVLYVLYIFCGLDGSVEPLCCVPCYQVPQVTVIAPLFLWRDTHD